MFTGLIEDIGSVVRAERRGELMVLTIEPKILPTHELVLGESISIDGTCLTVTECDKSQFKVLAGPETLKLTTVGRLRAGVRVNLERALLATDRLGGHIVAGHVDGLCEVAKKRPQGPALDVTLRGSRDLMRYVVKKGSVAVDGISMTVNHVDETSFTVGLIPHTIEHTTLADKNIGDKVNLEVDIVGKYVEKFVKGHVNK